MPTYRTAYRYYFKKGNKVVHVGITDDIDQCEYEHKNQPGCSKGHIVQVGERTTLKIARQWKKENLSKAHPD